jgi:hypothetical protein
MRKSLAIIIITTIFLMMGTGYGSEKIIDAQNAETSQETFWEKSETLREVAGGIAVFLVLAFVFVKCYPHRPSMTFSFIPW